MRQKRAPRSAILFSRKPCDMRVQPCSTLAKSRSVCFMVYISNNVRTFRFQLDRFLHTSLIPCPWRPLAPAGWSEVGLNRKPVGFPLTRRSSRLRIRRNYMFPLRLHLSTLPNVGFRIECWLPYWPNPQGRLAGRKRLGLAPSRRGCSRDLPQRVGAIWSNPVART